ncbi:unnamed protein product [Mytilus edulis]|uniref:Uncharacterized protein n=1 Tax=Mytilus edulis TaxID=6550 RepID=A0A8S3SBC0_MYTED|nr:unnamed protein product [Mytilus edulis]
MGRTGKTRKKRHISIAKLSAAIHKLGITKIERHGGMKVRNLVCCVAQLELATLVLIEEEKNYQTKTEGHGSSSESTIDYDVESYKLLENNVETTSSAQVHASNNEDSTSNSSEDESIFSQILNKNQPHRRKTIKPKLKVIEVLAKVLSIMMWSPTNYLKLQQNKSYQYHQHH